MERKSATRAAGPEDSHAALAMGNTVDSWERFYDKFAQARDSARGVQMMSEWRKQMLAREVADVPALDRACAQNDSDDDSEGVEDA